MPYSIAQLLKGRSAPVCAMPEWTADHALSVMAESDFSQLPVVDEETVLVGMATAENIAHAIPRFGLMPEMLTVRDCMDSKPLAKTEDDEIADVVDDLKEVGSLVVVGEKSRVIGILTNYDLARYYREKAYSALLVEDIETTLRDFIMLGFLGVSPHEHHEDLCAAIASATAPDWEKDKLKKAITTYLGAIGAVQNLDPQAYDQALSVLTASKDKPKGFADLTFSELTTMWLERKRWGRYADVIPMDPAGIRKMLEKIRQIRNKIAHFKGEVTPAELKELKSCSDWMTQYSRVLLNAFGDSEAARSASASEQVEAADEMQVQISESATVEKLPAETIPQPDSDQEFGVKQSKYAGLAKRLSEIASDEQSAWFPFAAIEKMIGAPLPPTARTHRSWWANDAVSHVQSKVWLDAGWAVDYLDFDEQLVRFRRSSQQHSNF